MDRQEAQRISERFQKAIIAEFGKDYASRVIKQSFDEDSFSIKMSIQSKTRPVQSNVSDKKDDWNKYHAVFGIPKEWFGKTVKIKRTSYVIDGILPNRPKNCISLKSNNGKSFVVSKEYLEEFI